MPTTVQFSIMPATGFSVLCRDQIKVKILKEKKNIFFLSVRRQSCKTVHVEAIRWKWCVFCISSGHWQSKKPLPPTLPRSPSRELLWTRAEGTDLGNPALSEVEIPGVGGQHPPPPLKSELSFPGVSGGPPRRGQGGGRLRSQCRFHRIDAWLLMF